MLVNSTNGKAFLIDDEDFAVVSGGGWWVQGSERKGFYVAGRTLQHGKQKKTLLHRLLAKAQAGQVVDHINGNSLDNRKSNLRVCSLSQNNCNQRKRGASVAKNVIAEAGAKGALFWTAQVKFNGQRFRKRFPRTDAGLRDALAHARNLREAHHGEFARHE